MDARRRQWIAWDVLFYAGDLGTGLRDQFGACGLVVFNAFLCACKRNGVQGRMTYVSEADALAQMGLQSMPLVNEHGETWALDELWGYLARRRQVRRQRHGRVTDVISTTWEKWQKAPSQRSTNGGLSDASAKASTASAEVSEGTAKGDTQTGRSGTGNADELETIVGADSNPDPSLDPDPDVESDLDVDPDTPNAAESAVEAAMRYAAEQKAKGSRSPEGQGREGSTSEYPGDVVNHLLVELETMCTGDHQPTIHSETFNVIAQCVTQRAPLAVVRASMDKLKRNPPSLPRALLTVVQRECERRGLPTPLFNLELVKRPA